MSRILTALIVIFAAYVGLGYVLAVALANY